MLIYYALNISSLKVTEWHDIIRQNTTKSRHDIIRQNLGWETHQKSEDWIRTYGKFFLLPDQ